MPTPEAADLPTTKQRKPTKRLTRTDIGLMLQYKADGVSQRDIAKRLDCDPSVVCRWLEDLTDTTETAKQYLRGSALNMAQSIVKKGKPSDHVQALKGLSVLHEEHASTVQVFVGGTGTVNIGLVTSPVSPVMHRLSDETGSDKVGYVNVSDLHTTD